MKPRSFADEIGKYSQTLGIIRRRDYLARALETQQTRAHSQYRADYGKTPSEADITST